MSFNPRMFGVSPKGVKLQPINLKESSDESIHNAFSGKVKKLPHHYEMLKKQYSSTYRQKLMENDTFNPHEQVQMQDPESSPMLKSIFKKEEYHPLSETRATGSTQQTLSSSLKAEDSLSGTGKNLTPLTLPHHNFIQLKSKSRMNIQLQQQQQELSTTTKLSDIQKKKDVSPSKVLVRTPRTESTMPTSALQSVRVFGDEKSAVHSQRAKLCIETLMEGCIDAFCELFELSHREPVVRF
jgi:hypothetical protein